MMSIAKLINAAANKRADDGFDFLLDGDLSQMSAQEEFLVGQGFRVGQRNVYPALRNEDVEKALTLIWSRKVKGWWHYESKLVKLGICTQEEYDKAIGRAK